MGGIIFKKGELADTLAETAGYKAGLALSFKDLHDHLSDADYPTLLRASEKRWIRLRSEEYEALFHKLLHRIGYTETEFDGDYAGIGVYHRYKRTALREYMKVYSLLTKRLEEWVHDKARPRGSSLDTADFLQTCAKRWGRTGLDIGYELLRNLSMALLTSPYSQQRFVEWRDPVRLEWLFGGSKATPEKGRFIDQRFIDYLSVNESRLAEIHWRKLEQFVAEFFENAGCRVDLGPGRGDDGVDVRVWRPASDASIQPLCLVQCKRQRAKVGKVTVKGLHADVQFEKARFGVVVTTSELSPGARTTIVARGYPIVEVNQPALRRWLKALRTPGTGIIRV
jgi:restriction system protein